RIMRPGNLNPTDHAFVMQCPVEQRRRHDANVDDVHAADRQRRHQSVAQHGPARPIVAPDRDRPLYAALGQERGIRPADGTRGFGREVPPDDAANVVLTEDPGRDGHRFGAVGIGTMEVAAAWGVTACGTLASVSPTIFVGKMPKMRMTTADTSTTLSVNGPAGAVGSGLSGRGFMNMTWTTCK